MTKPVEEMTPQELADRIVELTGSKRAAKRLIHSMPDPPRAPKEPNPVWTKAKYRRWLAFDLRLYGHKRKDIAAHLGCSLNRVGQDLSQCQWEMNVGSRELLRQMFGAGSFIARDSAGHLYITTDGRRRAGPLSDATD